MAHRVCEALSFALVYRTEGVDGSCIPRGSKQPRTLSLAGRRRPNSGEERFRSGKFRATTNCRATHPSAPPPAPRRFGWCALPIRARPRGAGTRRPNPAQPQFCPRRRHRPVKRTLGQGAVRGRPAGASQSDPAQFTGQGVHFWPRPRGRRRREDTGKPARTRRCLFCPLRARTAGIASHRIASPCRAQAHPRCRI
ncbi:hypothetical protein PVAP13_7NG122724 [Panicum virgatum]|uniref:Uncharacterized protein n=1 Tax=Panicum virgatum TaxID=38727 RepID=A0A8T0PZJ3_PANVG|nr:hypothetical protein PVAP13_7NG122724 [Panicum virgatum]